MKPSPAGLKTARTRAAGVVAELGLTGPPVPVEELVESHGLRVLYEHLPAETSAVLIRQPAGTRVIAVNASHAPTRQRFSLAHELGHALLHLPDVLSTEGEAVVDRPLEVLFRDGLASEGTNRVEIEANTFAAEVLMPVDLVRGRFTEALRRHPHSVDRAIESLARDFEVSPQAMGYRLTNLHLIDPA